MPAALPGSTPAENLANPSAGQAIIFDALSGPKGSPFDVRKLSFDANNHPVYTNDAANQTPSTGALCTGIGFGCNAKVNNPGGGATVITPDFTDDTGEVPSGKNSSYVYIGGGRSNADGTPNPYTAGFAPGNGGNGGSRDAGAGPAFTCFAGKWVTATGAVANGAVIETGYVNRSGVALAAGQFAFGSASAAQAAPA